MGGTDCILGSRKRLRGRAMIVAAVAALLASGSAAKATDYQWNINASGLYDLSTNWSPAGIPSLSADTATFNQTGTYTVTFANNRSITSAEVDNGNVTWALSGLTSTLTAATGLTVGFVDGQTARLTFSNGTVTTSSNVEIATSAADTGFLTVNSHATFNAGGLIRIGDAGTGTLSVINGGNMTTSAGGAAVIGATATSLGAASVSGSGSKWVLNGSLTGGQSRTGSVSL